MANLRFDCTKGAGKVCDNCINSWQDRVTDAHKTLTEGTGAGNDFLGWLRLPLNYDKEEFARIKEVTQEIRDNADIFVVIGIGGSYLGARAVIEMLKGPMYNMVPGKDKPQVIFLGCNISGSYLVDCLKMLEGKSVYVNVISKSGTTTEPAIAFRVIKDYMEKRYGMEECSRRIVVTTDAHRGALKTVADKCGYREFVVPDDIGGRFSVLTAVGLLPIAVAGADIDQLMAGAAHAMDLYKDPDLNNNDCYRYAVARNLLLNKGYGIEILTNYEPALHSFGEWWKQLYGESEGKDGKGIFPAAVDCTTDLHSMGQYIQDGRRVLFETVLNVESAKDDVVMEADEHNYDGMNFLAGMDLHYINSKATMGTVLAHNDGGNPILMVHIPALDEFTIGQMICFFELACGISGYLLGVNPFDQPGVEEYKKNMFALLGKPGYEDRKQELEARL
ncbi:MAG: glucose-6-phosphate isomerase [Clostridia bacterium]|nr:glucose-6-phosphate isomerase [Clostridia bacterium]